MPTITCYLGANGLYNNSVQMWYLHAIEDGALWLDSIVCVILLLLSACAMKSMEYGKSPCIIAK